MRRWLTSAVCVAGDLQLGCVTACRAVVEAEGAAADAVGRQASAQTRSAERCESGEQQPPRLTHSPTEWLRLTPLSLHRNNDAHYCSTSSAISRIQQQQQQIFGESMAEPPPVGAAARPPTAAPHAQKPTATPCPCCKWCSAFIRSVGGQICRSLLPSEPRNVRTIFLRRRFLRMLFLVLGVQTSGVQNLALKSHLAVCMRKSFAPWEFFLIIMHRTGTDIELALLI